MGKKEFSYFKSNGIELPFYFKRGSKNLNVIFQPYVKINQQKTEFKEYKFIDDLPASTLYILDYEGGFNIFSNGDNLLEKSTLELIEKITKEFHIEKKAVLLIGEKKAGLISLYFGMKYEYHFLSFMPLLNFPLHFHDKNIVRKNRLFEKSKFTLNYIKEEILAKKATRKGIVYFSHYDVIPESYDDELFRGITQKNKIELCILENWYAAIDIKTLNEKVFFGFYESIRVFSETGYMPLQGINIDSEKKIYENEKVYHEIIKGRNRIVKYLENNIAPQKIKTIIFAFNPLVTPEELNDVRAGYFYRFLTELDAEIVNIRDAFALNGGWYLYENGDNYPEMIISSFIEKKLKEENIKKENAILFGSSKGGFSALYYGKKMGFSNIIAIAPIMDPSFLLVKKQWSVLGIKVEKEKTEKYRLQLVRNKISEKLDVISKKSEVRGIIWYSKFDEMDGTKIDKEFILSHRNIEFIEVERRYKIDKKEISHSKIAQISLDNIIDEINKIIIDNSTIPIKKGINFSGKRKK